MGGNSIPLVGHLIVRNPSYGTNLLLQSYYVGQIIDILPLPKYSSKGSISMVKSPLFPLSGLVGNNIVHHTHAQNLRRYSNYVRFRATSLLFKMKALLLLLGEFLFFA